MKKWGGGGGGGRPPGPLGCYGTARFKLFNRDHKPNVINKAFKKLSNSERLQDQKKEIELKKRNSPVIFTTQYNPFGPNIRSIVAKHVNILSESSLKEVFPSESIFVAFKRLPNLKEQMVRFTINTIKNIDAQPGYERSCDSCDNFVDHVSSFKCNATGKTFKIKRKIRCNSKYVIYMAYCTKCKRQGVGSTNNWKLRLGNYKSHIKKCLGKCNIVNHFVKSCNDIFIRASTYDV